MKKLLSCFIALILVLGLTALPALAEDAEFTIVVGRNPYDKSDGYMTKFAPQLAEKNTGVKIDFQEIEASVLGEKVNIILATGDLPDAFLSAMGETYLVENLPQFTPLEDYLNEETTPNLMKTFEKYPDLIERLTQPDGHIYSLPTSFYGEPNNDAWGVPFINKSWLDKLGLPVPTTTDEFYEVCKAVKAGDPNENGLADEIAVSFANPVGCPFYKYAGFLGHM